MLHVQWLAHVVHFALSFIGPLGLWARERRKRRGERNETKEVGRVVLMRDFFSCLRACLHERMAGVIVAGSKSGRRRRKIVAICLPSSSPTAATYLGCLFQLASFFCCTQVSHLEPGNYVAATNIFNEKFIKQQADMMWDQIDEGVSESDSELFLEKAFLLSLQNRRKKYRL